MDKLNFLITSFFFLILMFFSQTCKAQVKPTPVEFLLGNKRIQGQSIISKSFPNSKFGIFSLTTLAGDYKNENKTNNEVVTNVQLNYDIYKGIKIASGASFNSMKGFSPTIGLQYQYNKTIMFIINPTFDLNAQVSFKTFALLEYASKKEKASLYVRLQGMYISNLATGAHERSFIQGRLGVFYNGFATGLGINQDYYGAAKIEKTNIGLFLHYEFM